MNWLEISLTLDGELAEPVAEVLGRYAQQGISIESTGIEAGPDDEGRPVGPVRVRAFLPADDADALEATREKIERDLFYLGMIQPLPQPTYTKLEFDDYRGEQWKVHYKPVHIGERLVVMPVWLYKAYKNGPESRPSDIYLLMEPGMAFGTGTHPTTQLCLALLETYVQADDSVFDLGCGSGILSVAAVKLGAARALAVDIDPVAIPVVRENAELNRVADKIEAKHGSLELVHPQSPASDFQPPTFSITVANILARIIVNLLEQGLAETLAPGGTLILSGILAEQADDVLGSLAGAGLSVVEQRQSGDWIALAARRPPNEMV